MSRGRSTVLLLSLMAITAAARFVGPAGPAAPTEPAVTDTVVPPAGDPPTPILAAARDRGAPVGRRSAGGRDAGDEEASTTASAPQRSEADLERARAEFEEYARSKRRSAAIRLVAERDPVCLRIRDEVERLRQFGDDLAIRYVDLSDAEYRSARDQVARHLPGASERNPQMVPLPDRASADVDGWLREPMDLSDLEDFDGAPTDAAIRIERQRRQAAREYEFERARLHPDSIRSYARSRTSRRQLETWEDVREHEAAAAAWRQRRDTWVAANGSDADDARELAELVRTIPFRVWAPLPVQPVRDSTAEEHR